MGVSGMVALNVPMGAAGPNRIEVIGCPRFVVTDNEIAFMSANFETRAGESLLFGSVKFPIIASLIASKRPSWETNSKS
jgi:hypothetical protein